MEATGFVF